MDAVDAVDAAGGRLIARTVNDAGLARDLAALGVDALCSDVPDIVRATVNASLPHAPSVSTG